MVPVDLSNHRARIVSPQHTYPHLLMQLAEPFIGLYKDHNAKDSSDAEANMRKRHQEEAAEATRLNSALATFKNSIENTTRLKRKVEEQATDIKILKGINHDLVVERATQCSYARKMQKLIDDGKNEKKTLQALVEKATKEQKTMQNSVEDAEKETEAMKARLEDGRKVYNELIRDIHFEKAKRAQAEQVVQEFVAAQKAIAERFGLV